MKTILISLFFVIVISSNLSAQLESYARYTIGGTIEPNINFLGTKKIVPNLNLTYYFLVESQWSEALIGVAYSPVSWLELGLSTGIEYNPAIYRFAGSVWIVKGKTSLLMLGEKGNGKDNY